MVIKKAYYCLQHSFAQSKNTLFFDRIKGITTAATATTTTGQQQAAAIATSMTPATATAAGQRRVMRLCLSIYGSKWLYECVCACAWVCICVCVHMCVRVLCVCACCIGHTIIRLFLRKLAKRANICASFSPPSSLTSLFYPGVAQLPAALMHFS